MANIQLAWDNRVVDGFVPLSDGYGTYDATLANMGKANLAAKWISPGTSAAATRFTVDLADSAGVPPEIALIALCSHNLSLSATVRVRGNATPFGGTSMVDSGTLNVYPGGVVEADRRGLRQNWYFKLPSLSPYRYWRVDISDSGNPAGFVSVGRFFAARMVWQPTVNMLADSNALGWESNAEVQKSIGGAEWWVDAEPNRFARFALHSMPKAEMLGNAFDLQRVGAGSNREVLMQWDPQDSVLGLVRRTIFGRLRQLSPLEEPNFGYLKTAFEVKELL